MGYNILINCSLSAMSFDTIGCLLFGNPFGCLDWPMHGHPWLDALLETELFMVMLTGMLRFLPTALGRWVLTMVVRALRHFDQNTASSPSQLLKKRLEDPPSRVDLLAPLIE